MNPNHASTITELRRLAKHEVTHHATSPAVVLRVIEDLQAERDRAMAALGRRVNYDDIPPYYDYPWMSEHGFMSRDKEYFNDCEANLNIAIAEHYLAEGNGDGR